MNPKDNPPNKIDLDLSLGLPREEEEEEEALVPEQGPYMQQLRSVSDPPQNIEPSPLPPLSAYHMTPPAYYTNVTNHWNGSVAALPPSPPLGVVQPPQAIQGGANALETSRTVPRLGRPPAKHQARHRSSRAAVAGAVENKVGEKEIVPPYPWATTRQAVIHNLRYLFSNNINEISGQVQCKPCEITQTLKYNLKEKFEELYRYMKANKEELRQRAPHLWMCPKLTPCSSCKSGMKPVISDKKEEINWLFLLLGQMLGCCTLEQLRYFCDKTSQHRTGAKDRVLYLTYIGLCKQLESSENV